MLKNMLFNRRAQMFLGGVATAILGGKILQTKTVRDFAVKTMATGMQVQKDMQVAYANLKEDAQDLMYEAKMKQEENERERTCATADEEVIDVEVEEEEPVHETKEQVEK